MATMTTLYASARYGYGGKQFIARIDGRDAKFTFARTFIGKKWGKRGEDSKADVDDPGLYETRDIDSKGRHEDRYYVVEALPDGTIEQATCTKEEAMRLAKLIGEMTFEEAVAKVWPPKTEESEVAQ